MFSLMLFIFFLWGIHISSTRDNFIGFKPYQNLSQVQIISCIYIQINYIIYKKLFGIPHSLFFYHRTKANGNSFSGPKVWFCIVRSAKDNCCLQNICVLFILKHLIKLILSFHVSHHYQRIIMCCEISLRMKMYFKICAYLLR